MRGSQAEALVGTTKGRILRVGGLNGGKAVDRDGLPMEYGMSGQGIVCHLWNNKHDSTHQPMQIMARLRASNSPIPNYLRYSIYENWRNQPQKQATMADQWICLFQVNEPEPIKEFRSPTKASLARSLSSILFEWSPRFVE
jgi:hypothetical protein